jgi:DNA sulfur modification protein DndB
MPASYPALKGKIGDTEYYLVVMPASWVSNNLTIPSEMEGWEGETIDERYQRRINYSRVATSIAPYLANDNDRFFGSLIVTVINDQNMSWEGLTTVAKEIPGAYRASAQQIGFLHLSGEEVMVPLDGQHRLAAMKFAITGNDQQGNAIAGLTPNPKVGADLVTLMLIRHEVDRARKIFNKVNRYARPTSKADNLVTSDDDFLAVLAREIAGKALPARLVNVSGNTIAAKAEHVTTLATIYSILEVVLADQHPPQDRLPDPAVQSLLRKEGTKFFSELFKRVKTMQRALANPDPDGDAKRIELRESDLLMKPVVQLATAAAVHELQLRGLRGQGIKLEDAFERVNKLDWRRENQDWQQVLLNGEKVVSGETARRFATRYIAYQLGMDMQAAEVAALREDFRELLPRGSKRDLPKPLRA